MLCRTWPSQYEREFDINLPSPCTNPVAKVPQKYEPSLKNSSPTPCGSPLCHSPLQTTPEPVTRWGGQALPRSTLALILQGSRVFFFCSTQGSVSWGRSASWYLALEESSLLKAVFFLMVYSFCSSAAQHIYCPIQISIYNSIKSITGRRRILGFGPATGLCLNIRNCTRLNIRNCTVYAHH